MNRFRSIAAERDKELVDEMIAKSSAIEDDAMLSDTADVAENAVVKTAAE